MLGYPLVRLVVMSLQEFGLRQQFGAPAPWVGLDNFGAILGRRYFWDVLRRTIIFCLVNVVLTMGLGTLSPCSCGRSAGACGPLVSVGLLLAWAMPALTATVVWQWIFDTQYGLVNWLLTTLGWRLPGPLLAQPSRCRSSSWPRSSWCGWASRSWPSRSTPA